MLSVNSENEASEAESIRGSRPGCDFDLPALLMNQSRLFCESAAASASSRVTWSDWISAYRLCSNEMLSGARLYSIASLIAGTSPCSIRSAMWRVLSRTSTVGTRPPRFDRTRRCETMAFTATDMSWNSAWRVSGG